MLLTHCLFAQTLTQIISSAFTDYKMSFTKETTLSQRHQWNMWQQLLISWCP